MSRTHSPHLALALVALAPLPGCLDGPSLADEGCTYGPCEFLCNASVECAPDEHCADGVCQPGRPGDDDAGGGSGSEAGSEGGGHAGSAQGGGAGGAGGELWGGAGGALGGGAGGQIGGGAGGGVETSPAALALTPAANDFGDVVLDGQSAGALFVVRNSGGVDTTALSVALLGADAEAFVRVGDACSGIVLPPEGICAIEVAFAPFADNGPHAAVLDIRATAGGQVTADLTGYALNPGALSAAASGDPGVVALGEVSSPINVQVFNLGGGATGALEVSLSDAQFELVSDGCSGVALTGGGSCALAIVFRPQNVGTATGSLSVFGTPGGATAVPLGGTGAVTVQVQRLGGGSGDVWSTPEGIDCGAYCSAQIATPGLSLAAAAGAQSTFVEWGGACAGTGACTPSLAADAVVTARFEAHQTLTVSTSGSGSVARSPAGISCGTGCSTHPYGANVQLTATAGGTSTFLSWSGACSGTNPTCTVSMVQARSVTANFASLGHVLDVTVVSWDNVGFGTVASSPGGISCPNDCTENYPHNAQVTLIASPAAGSFVYWEGPCDGNDPNGMYCDVTMDQARSVKATFGVTFHTLTLQKLGNGTGDVEGPNFYCWSGCPGYSIGIMHGVQAVLTAWPSMGSSFTGWGGACAGVTGSTCTVTMDQARTVYATFD